MLTEGLLIAATALFGLTIAAWALLRGWQGWLALKNREIDLLRHANSGRPEPAGKNREIDLLRHANSGRPEPAGKNREIDLLRHANSGRPEQVGSHEGTARIEIADLKERIRKLEAIANGVDL